MTIFETTALQISGISETSKIGKLSLKGLKFLKCRKKQKIQLFSPEFVEHFYELRAWIACYISKRQITSN